MGAALTVIVTKSKGIAGRRARRNGDTALLIVGAQWYPQMGERWVAGVYERRVPYSGEREIVGDILRHGEAVTVVTPKTFAA